jgi:hypothetical protein
MFAHQLALLALVAVAVVAGEVYFEETFDGEQAGPGAHGAPAGGASRIMAGGWRAPRSPRAPAGRGPLL